MEYLTSMTLEEYLAVTKLEDGEPIAFCVVDFEGNWIMDSDLVIKDFYVIKDWRVNKVIVRSDGLFEIEINGGSFIGFNLKHVVKGGK